MQNDKHIYKVAEHYFEVCFNSISFHSEIMQKSYAPFEAREDNKNTLFSATICDNVRTDDIKSCIYLEKHPNIDTGHYRIYTTNEGWLFEQTQPFSEHTNGRIRIDKDFCNAEIAVRGNELQRWFAFNSALQICYLLATVQYDTVLTHSSSVVNDGKAYLFLGKSGTGKSTHSSLWLKHIAGTILLNDDHPVIRVSQQGAVIVYGTPWSGKTPCYKNLSAPLGGIVRIRRAKQNSILQLNAVQAYSSLTASFAGMTWVRAMADCRHETISKVIENVPCYTLSCLPDEESARICYAKVTNHPQEKEEARRNRC